MEGLIVLVVLVLVGGVVILPIASFIRAGRAVRDTENLRHKVAALEFELRHLTRERHPPTPSPEATAHEPSVPPETTDYARTDLPEFLTPVPPQNGTSGAPGANGGRTGSERTGGAGADARRRKRDGKAKGKRRDGFRKVQRACPVSRQAFTGRVQPRMERTLRAMTPHFQSNITSALRSLPSFGD